MSRMTGGGKKDRSLPFQEVQEGGFRFHATMWGKVQRGNGRGTRLGFPTANLRLHRNLRDGIYLAMVRVHERLVPALAFVGAPKTFRETTRRVEVFLFADRAHLYGQWIAVQLLQRLRGNKRFSNTTALQRAMRHDEKIARKYFNTRYRHHTMKRDLEARKICEMRGFGVWKNRRCTKSTLRIFPHEKQAVRDFRCLMESGFIV